MHSRRPRNIQRKNTPSRSAAALHAGGSTAHSTHRSETSGQLGILLLNLQLSTGGLGVGDSIDNLGLGASKLSSPLKVLERLRDLALLQQQLSHGADGNVTLGIDWKNGGSV